MKKLILILLLLFPILTFSQKSNIDTSVVCIPYQVAKKIALDLNLLDSLNLIHNLTILELYQTKNIVDVKNDIIKTMELKEKNYNDQIQNEKEKFEIVDTQNKDLRKEVKKLKTKNTFIQIIGVTLLSTITIFSILK